MTRKIDPWYWCAITLFKLYFKLFHRLRIYGVDDIYRGAAFIASNHASFYDPPLISATWPEDVHFLARKLLFSNRFFGFLIRKLHAHPIHGSARDAATFKIIEDLVKDNQKVVIFPEGSRSLSGHLHSLKPGLAMLALRTNTPIIPLYIRGTFEAWPANSRWPKIGKNLDCVFGKPLFPNAYQNLEKKEAIRTMTQDVHTAIDNLRIWLESQ